MGNSSPPTWLGGENGFASRPPTLPLRYNGHFETIADLALLAWAVQLPTQSTVQMSNCASFGDAVLIYWEIPQGLLDGWKQVPKWSDEETADLFRCYTPKQKTGNGLASMKTAEYLFWG